MGSQFPKPRLHQITESSTGNFESWHTMGDRSGRSGKGCSTGPTVKDGNFLTKFNNLEKTSRFNFLIKKKVDLIFLLKKQMDFISF